MWGCAVLAKTGCEETKGNTLNVSAMKYSPLSYFVLQCPEGKAGMLLTLPKVEKSKTAKRHLAICLEKREGFLETGGKNLP